MLLFDKMLSDNINLDFFQEEFSYEREIIRDDLLQGLKNQFIKINKPQFC